MSIDDCCFDVCEVGYPCKELVGKHSNIEIVVTAVIVVRSVGKRVGSIFCSGVVFN